jgi:hypothetical protein
MAVRRADAVACVALLLLATVCSRPRLAGPIDLRWDAGVYYVLGTALAQGHGYALLNEPGEIRATQYPPALPAIIAGWQLATGSDDPLYVGRLLRWQSAAVFVLFVLATYALARRYLPPVAAFAAALLCLVNAYTHFMADQATADVPFATAATFFAVAATGERSRVNGMLAGVSCALAYLLRTAGLALMVAWVADALLARRLRATAGRLALCVVPVLGWNAYVAAVENAPEYNHVAYAYQRADYSFYNVSYARNVMLKDPFRPEAGRITIGDVLTDRVLPGLQQLPGAIGESLTSQIAFWDAQLVDGARLVPFRRVTVRLLLVFVGGVVLLQAIVLILRGEPLVSLCVLVSVALICATPWPGEMVRYLMPLNGMTAMLLLRGLLAGRAIVIRRFSESAAASAVAVSLLMSFLIGEAAATLTDFYSRHHSSAEWTSPQGRRAAVGLFFYRPSYAALDPALDWIREHARKDDVIASSMPHFAYIRTGLHSVMVSFARDAARAQSDLDSVPVEFLVVQQGGPFAVEPFVGNVVANGLWTCVFVDSERLVRVYRRRQAA